MGLSNYEKESIFLFNEADKTAEIYTHNPALKKQLSELCVSHPEQVRQEPENKYGGQIFVLPKKWIKIRPPRVLSQAQKEVLERMNRKRGNP